MHNDLVEPLKIMLSGKSQIQKISHCHSWNDKIKQMKTRLVVGRV